MAPLVSPKNTRFITLTLKHRDAGLKEQVAFILAAFRRLRSRKLWKATQLGGIAFLEITRGARNTHWHVHLHVVATGMFIDQRELSAAWLAVTGDSSIVDVRFVREARNACRYVLKYVSKPIATTVADDAGLLQDYMQAMRNLRTYCVFGDWREHFHNDTPDHAEWETVASLATLIRRSAHGDARAAEILHAVDRWASPASRPEHPPDYTAFAYFPWESLEM